MSARLSAREGAAFAVVALFIITGLLPDSARAEFPDRPIRFVVPFAAGGGADALVRAVGEGMSKYLKQPVIIENRPGGDATIGSIYVKAQPADGYTILFGSNTGFSGAPALHKTVGYDPLKDFTPISLMGMFPIFITRLYSGADETTAPLGGRHS